MSICAALAAKTRAKKAGRIAQNLAQAARENAQLGLPAVAAQWHLAGAARIRPREALRVGIRGGGRRLRRRHEQPTLERAAADRRPIGRFPGRFLGEAESRDRCEATEAHRGRRTAGESKEQVAARLRDEDARADRERNASSPVKSPPFAVYPQAADRRRAARFFRAVALRRGHQGFPQHHGRGCVPPVQKDKRAGGVIRYELSDGYVEVKAGPDGMASVWDYDLVLMMVSHLTEAMNRYREGRGEKPGRTYRPHVSDILKFCRRGDGRRQADEVEGR
jgi:hypothetical protein